MKERHFSFSSRLTLGLLLGLVVMGTLATSNAFAWPNDWPSPWPSPRPYPRHNPTVWDSGSRVTGIYRDPYTGQIRVRTDRDQVRASALDPYRNHVDPGSRRYVNRIERDMFGNVYRVRGYAWTSYGRPHSTLTRTRIRYSGGGIVHEENETVLRMAPNATGTGRANNDNASERQESRDRRGPSVQPRGSFR